MSLDQGLKELREKLRANHSADTKAIMDRATEKLVQSGIADNSLKEGDSVPHFALPNALSNTVAIQDLLKEGAVVISFYRGQWCPYCNLELRSLQQALPKIKAQGATLVAISPQTPDNSLSTAQKNELDFEVLSDVGNSVAKRFGLVFQLPAQLRQVYDDFGINLPAHNGDDTFELPIPATYVVAPNGAIAQAFVNPVYTQRLDPEEIVAALQSLQVSA